MSNEVRLKIPVEIMVDGNFAVRASRFLDDIEIRKTGRLTFSYGMIAETGAPAIGVQLAGGDIHSFDMDEIEKITQIMEQSMHGLNLSRNEVDAISTLVVTLRHGAKRAKEICADINEGKINI